MVKIATFFHDGAVSNNFLPIFKKYKSNYEWFVYVYKDSPAYKIFTANAITVIELTNTLQTLTNLNPSIIYVGTSWQNKTHLEFIQIAKMLHIPSIAAMDHWVNYRQRFSYPDETWEKNLPDFISVNDEDAYATALKLQMPKIIKLKFYALVEDIKLFKNSSIQEKNSILFISEPTKKVAFTSYKDEDYWGFNEFDVCEEICQNIDKFQTNSITLRLHPSDEEKKYNYLKEKYPHINIRIENPYNKPLIQSLCEHKIVIGIDGFVLFEAMVLGKISLSLIPSQKRECFVPLFEENKISSISSNFKLEHFKQKNLISQIESFGIDFASMIDAITTKH